MSQNNDSIIVETVGKVDKEELNDTSIFNPFLDQVTEKVSFRVPEDPIISRRNYDYNNVPPFKLQFLCSLIAITFGGNRNDLHEFIANCDNAYKFVHYSQEAALLAYILSKLTGNAKAQTRDKEFYSWIDLRSTLLQLYSDAKHYTQLMEELNTMKQNANETVVQFYNRLDHLQTRILNNISSRYTDERFNRYEMIRELTTQRFIFHSLPDISRFLRSRDYNSLSEYLNAALEEERALRINKIPINKPKPKIFCTFCKMDGHLFVNCRKKPHQQYNINQNQTKFCHYCKKNGHLINDCYKRKNKNYSGQRTPTSQINTLNLNESYSQSRTVPVENIQ